MSELLHETAPHVTDQQQTYEVMIDEQVTLTVQFDKTIAADTSSYLVERNDGRVSVMHRTGEVEVGDSHPTFDGHNQPASSRLMHVVGRELHCMTTADDGESQPHYDMISKWVPETVFSADEQSRLASRVRDNHNLLQGAGLEHLEAIHGIGAIGLSTVYKRAESA